MGDEKRYCYRCGDETDGHVFCEDCLLEAWEKGGMWTICSFCGRLFFREKGERERFYCTKTCHNMTLYVRQRIRRAQAKKNQKKQTTPVEDECNFAYKKQIEFSKKGVEELERMNDEEEGTLNRGLKGSRKCHDCGKLTNDYRCDKCQKKWKKKNKLESIDGIDDENW